MPGGFSANVATFIGHGLARKGGVGKWVLGNREVFVQHVLNFSPTNANISCGHIKIVSDVWGKFGHKGTTKSLNFSLALTLGVKVRTTLAATKWQAREGILEYLFKT